MKTIIALVVLARVAAGLVGFTPPGHHVVSTSAK
jgi:hypothetical protein